MTLSRPATRTSVPPTSPRSGLHRPPLLALALLPLLASATPLRAATPCDELLRLVPGDTTFCLVVRELRQHSEQLAESPFLARFAASRLGRALAGAPELRGLADLDRTLSTQLGVSAVQWRDELIGDAVVMAYQAGPPGRPDLEQGLVLTWARDPKLAADLIDRLNAAQQKSGEVRDVAVREHQGRKYTRRFNTKTGGDEFIWQRGGVVAFTNQESALRRLIDLDQQAPPADAGPSPVGQQLRALGIERSLAAWWINPRSFDPELDRKVAAAKGAEKAFLQNFRRYWLALEGAALFLRLDKQIELGVALRARTEELPAPARRLFTEADKPSALWGTFSDDALVALAGRIDLASLAEAVGEFLTPEARHAARLAAEQSVGAVPGLGRDRLAAVLGRLGPDLGFAVSAPAPADPGWQPRALMAVRLRTDPAEAAAVLNALQFFAGFAAFSYNSRHEDQIRLDRARVDGADVHFLANDTGFPPGLQPAFAVKGGFLVVADSVEAIRRFRPSADGPAVPAPNGGEVPWLRVSLKSLGDYLTSRRPAIRTFLTQDRQLSTAEADRQLDTVLMGLELLDRVEVFHKSGAGTVLVTLRIRTVVPLRK
jgi:hypothetical protein